jgi:hypothetical protein
VILKQRKNSIFAAFAADSRHPAQPLFAQRSQADMKAYSLLGFSHRWIDELSIELKRRVRLFMQRETSKESSRTSKAKLATESTLQAASSWTAPPQHAASNKPNESAVSQFPWARYIDSRLKQFCTR